jgi:multidrug efflux pump subunit AcrB
MRFKSHCAAESTRSRQVRSDLVNQVMSFGSPTPIEVAVTGANLTASRGYADKLKAEMAKVSALRDLQFGQALDYPVRQVQIDRERAGQLGVTVEEVGRSLVAATSSSRFVTPNYWADPNSGIACQVQVEVPQHTMTSMEDILNVPVMQNGAARPLLGDVATVTQATAIGEYNRYNQQRMITLTANVHGEDLGTASDEVFAAVSRAGDPPTGVTVSVRGQVAPMQQTLDGLRSGLGLAIVAIFLLLAAYFQSLKGRAHRDRNDPGRHCRRGHQPVADRKHVERAVIHGRHHGNRRRGGERNLAGHLC